VAAGRGESTVTDATTRNSPPPPPELAAARTEAATNRAVAGWILAAFDAFYAEFRRLTWNAQRHFEERNYVAAVADARIRLGHYGATVYALADRLRAVCPHLVDRGVAWDEITRVYASLSSGRYEAGLAIAYLNSVKRRVHIAGWTPVEYAFGDHAAPATDYGSIAARSPGGLPVSPERVRELLQVAGLACPFHDLAGDSVRVSDRINELLASGAHPPLTGIEILRAGFFRNRGAYLVGRFVFADGTVKPLAIALQNPAEGIVVRALLTTISQVHNLFSSTNAAFQVTNPRFHELAAFLHSIMPRRPLGLQYSTIGFHHVSKVAMMNEITRNLTESRETLDNAPGSRGTVAIAFSAPCLAYVLKVIRDRPTSGYKWETYPGAAAVLEKYRAVHDINRTGSMLDNTLYYNLKLDRAWFSPALLDELLREAGNAVRIQDDTVVFKYLIVQRTLMPLNVYLQQAAPEKALRVISNLGHCIRNNAAANIFNRDFDVRNYGVTRYLEVYLYDYDAVEALTDVKVRTNLGRVEGEEGVPDWFFESGIIFLPEEIDEGLRVNDRDLMRSFRTEHAELLTVGYWEGVQATLRAGDVPGIRCYPESCHLRDAAEQPFADE
jgi:isocitrate dehydrogenase kinase/phosphatase